MKTLKATMLVCLTVFASLSASQPADLKVRQHYEVVSGRGVSVFGVTQDNLSKKVWFNFSRFVAHTQQNDWLENQLDCISRKTITTDDSIFVVTIKGMAYSSKQNINFRTINLRDEIGSDQDFFQTGLRYNGHFWLLSGSPNRSSKGTGGLYQLNAKFEIVDSLTYDNGRCPFEDAIDYVFDKQNQKLWLGTSDGVWVFDLNSKTFTQVLEGNFFMAINWNYDKTKILAAGTGKTNDNEAYSKFVEIDRETYAWYQRDYEYKSYRLYQCKDIMEDEKGNVYFGHGINFDSFSGAAAEMQPRDYPLTVLGSDGKWYEFRNNFKFIDRRLFDSETDPHPFGGIFDMMVDDQGYLWLGTYRGVYQLESDVFTTGVEEQHIACGPNDFNLSQNFPNPFNSTTTINYSISVSQHVNISVYDMRGRLVETLVNQHKIAGKYQLTWTPESYVTSGLYLVRFEENENRRNKVVKMHYIK